VRFGSLFYNNHQGGDIKTQALAEAFIFQTTFRNRGVYFTSTNITLILQIMLGSYIALYHGSKAVSKRFTIYITFSLLPQQT
jgi:hypothetical protein